MSEKIKKATLEQIVQKKLQGEMDKFCVKNYYSKTLEMDIEIRKIPVSKYLQIVDTIENDESLDSLNLIIYNCCPMFRENTKEAMEVYGVQEPTDLPSAVLEDQVNEMKEICDLINAMYGLDKVEDAIKNSSEVMAKPQENSTGLAITSTEGTV